MIDSPHGKMKGNLENKTKVTKPKGYKPGKYQGFSSEDYHAGRF